MKKPLARLCAVCGKPSRPGDSTSGFRWALKLLGHPNWRDDKAHLSCIRRLQRKKDKP